ncbi:unnamed protein product [marine sediment metagenome]|uniref:SsuA/THI5-like domain-containing protein n=1 Tax=marine sediment metagenome TaxID=412755 RepID=X1LSW0_9ZZZZ
MKHRILLVFLALVLVVSLVTFAACKAEEEPPVVEEWQWPEKLAIVCGTGGSLAGNTGYTSELAKATGMTIRVVPEVNSMLKFKWVNQGRFFCVSDGSTVAAGTLEATEGFAVRDGGPFQLRLIWSYSISDLGFIVRGDSDIKTIYDIKPGTKIAELVAVPGMWKQVEALLAWIEVDEDDIIKVPGSSYGATLRAISGGQADVAFCFPPSPDVMEAATAPHGIRWLPLPYKEDPEGAKRFIEIRPTLGFGVMSQSPEATGVPSIVGMTPIQTRADADPELVYHFAKWMDENHDLYKDNYPDLKNATRDTLMALVETYFLPAHDGLIKYLKELGLWTEAHDARQVQNIAKITRYVDAYQEAIDMADEQGITVDPANEEWLELWENHKKRLGLTVFKMFVGLEE